MDPDIRPQDDLFGHVNGRWLDETEIPSDRSSWGPFVQLADVAEEQVREIIEDLAAERRPASDLDEDAQQDRRPVRLVHGRRADRRARHCARSGRSSTRSAALRDVRDLAAFLGEFERIGGARAVRLLRRHRRPQLRPLPVQHHPGRARAARRVLLPRRQVRRDPGEVRRLPRPTCSRWPATRTPPTRRATVLGLETRLAARATGSAPRPATSRRPTT